MADNNKIKEQLKEITERLEQGIKEVFESEKYKAYLNTMSKFYNYSFNNTMLIAMQRPDATLIAGYSAWQKKFDRHVMRGEKGIRIIAPAPIVKKEELEKLDPITQEPMLDGSGSPIMEEVEIRMPAFKVIPVFDVSQTDGKELPDITVDELNGTVENYEIFMQALTEVAPVPIGYEEIPDGVKGYYHLAEKRIAIQEGMSEIQTAKTTIHEIAHATLHDIDLKDKEIPLEARKDRKTREVEAESIAYTVCQHYGIDTSDYSFGYVAGWSSDKDLKELRSSLETIRKTSATLINTIDKKVEEIQLTSVQMSVEESQLSKEEAALLYGETDSFGIYQLKRGDELHFHRFESLESLNKHGLSVEKENYDLIYTAPLKEGQTLDDIFEEFNMFRPEDFTGHSLSVSDIVLLHKNGKNVAQYVDGFGFQEIPDFLKKEQELATDRGQDTSLSVKDIKQIGFGDRVFLYQGDKAVYSAKEQNVNHASWRKDMIGLDSSTSGMVRFNANEIEYVSFLDGRKAERKEEPFISRFYVIEDKQESIYKMQRYDMYKDAQDAYFSLPFDKQKAFGVENTHNVSLDFIRCKYGVDTQVMDCKKVDGWNNPEIYCLVEQQIPWDLLTNERTEIAYVYEDRFLYVQKRDEGYDYSVYDKDYKLLDGGIYDDPDVVFWKVAREILDLEGKDISGLQVINHVELEEKTELVNRIEPMQEVVAQEPTQTLTFYVAECMEFSSLGEYHENLTLDEAVRLYEAIPDARMNGVKGIGFVLHTDGNKDYMDSSFELLAGDTIDVDIVNYMQEFRENPLVQQALKDIVERFPDAEILDMETRARESWEAAESLNNMKPEGGVERDAKGLSIMEKLDLNKERAAKQNQSEKPQKEAVKKPERTYCLV